MSLLILVLITALSAVLYSLKSDLYCSKLVVKLIVVRLLKMTSNLFQSIGYDTEEKFCLNVGAPGPKALREAAKIMKIAANHCLVN